MKERREARELLFLRHLCRALSGVQEARWRMYHALDLEAPESREDAEVEHLTSLIRETAPLDPDAARERLRARLSDPCRRSAESGRIGEDEGKAVTDSDL